MVAGHGFMRFGLWSLILIGLGLTCLSSAEATRQRAPQRPREFLPGALKRLEELPQGRFRAQLDRLTPAAKQRALTRLQHFHFTELDLESLHADSAGGIFYADSFMLEAVPTETEPRNVTKVFTIEPASTNLTFHSRPGASNVLFLNFTGEEVSGTAWNAAVGRDLIPAMAFSTDADYSTFSDAEQLTIKRIWQRVAEDFAPFDIDVTTERPSAFGPRIALALITRNTDANGLPNPAATAGGVAYVDVFGSGDYTNHQPAWIYFDNLCRVESYIAEAVSHEIGHNLGLSHDAQTDGSYYYSGHGCRNTSWGPIMGSSYGRNVSQWSRGEY